MIRVGELGQHFYLATGTYRPVSKQNALVNPEQAPSQLLALAKSYITGTFLPGSADSESTDIEGPRGVLAPELKEWEVRNVIDGKVKNGKSYFLVDWAPTWMPESELDGSRELIDIFTEQRRHKS
jgi:hypothetical protein